MTDLPRKGFGAKDWVSFVFSLLALVLSLFTFYVSQYQVVDDLKVRIVRSSLDTTDVSYNPTGHRHSPDKLVAQVAVMNMGNRPAIVLGAQLSVGDDARKKEIREVLEKGLGRGQIDLTAESLNSRTTLKPIFPMVLQPHETRVVDLSIASDIVWNWTGFCPDSEHGNTKCPVLLLVQAIDSTGQEHTLVRPVGYVISLSETTLQLADSDMPPPPVLSVFR